MTGVCPNCFARITDPVATHCPTCGAKLGAIGSAPARPRPAAAPTAPPTARPRLPGGPSPSSGGALAPAGDDDRIGLDEAEAGFGFDRPGGPVKRSSLALFGALGAAALIVAVAVVAGGSSGDGGAAPTTAAAASSTTAVPTTRSAPATTRPPRSTTTTGPHGPYLAGVDGVELVLVNGRHLLVVDLGTGETRTVTEDLRVPEDLNRSVVVGDDVLLGGYSSLQTASLIDGGVVTEDVDFENRYPPCTWSPADVAGQVWAVPCLGGGTRTVEAVLWSVADHVAVGRLTFPEGGEFVAGFVPGIGFVLQGGGGIYRYGVDGVATRVADGRLLTLVGRSAARVGCDDELRCTTDLVDLETGDTRPLSLPEGVDLRNIDPNASVSPDGRRSAVMSYDDRGPRLFVLDGDSGAVTELPAGRGAFPSGAMAWSADGAWLFLQSDFGVAAWHVGADEPIELDLRNVRLLGARG